MMMERENPFTTLSLHGQECPDCSGDGCLPGCFSREMLQESKATLDKKMAFIKKGIRETTLQIGDLEFSCRQELDERYPGRVIIRPMVIQKIVILSGLLHNMLRYMAILRRDSKKINFLLSVPGNNILPTVDFREITEEIIAENAPDIGDLFRVDLYRPSEETEFFSVIPFLYRGLAQR
ncbi:uncharacterized protein [Lepeophtheirus salmonis]|uniref:Uncharacterized protein n=1 Tax=Lepeophtheirus salmonis TaxID=72036 RepID=A0A0K2TWR5_LEPSM|nr:uncharacterized protein LOC121126410 [Lepeophtheirus salmonis]